MMRYVVPMLLSAFVFPGSGQIHNGERTKGIVFIGATLAVVFALFVALIVIMAPMIPPTGGLMTVGESRAILTRLWAEHPGLLNAFGWLLAGVWAYGVLDAFLGARAKTRRDAGASAST